MIKALIFDFDGVIIDSFDFSFKIIHKFNPDIKEEDYRKFFMGNAIVEIKKKMTGVPLLTPEFNIKYIHEMKKHKLKEKNKKIIENLYQSYKLFIISSNIDQIITKYANQNGILEYFEEIYGIEKGINKVDKFDRLLKEFKLNKEDCVFITDTLGDILEAKKIGIKTIAISSGYHDKDCLVKGSPQNIIGSLEELEIILNN